MIDEFARLIPRSLLDTSGSAFYSGRDAFNRPSDLYILGLNPGGRVEDHADETVSWHSRKVVGEVPSNWSAYRDESWEGARPGEARMQRRMGYLFERIGRDPGLVPASNLIFLRSSREATLAGDLEELATQCWPFHHEVMSSLGVRVVVCLHKKAAKWVRDKVDARIQVDEYVESIRLPRPWRSRTFESATGVVVVDLTYPGIADWTNPASDPTGLVVSALRSVRQG